MTIRHLIIFIKVSEELSITKAANKLNISQPSVTQTIKELEKYYNIIIFERINKKLILTDHGKLLLEKAREVVSSFNDFELLASRKDLKQVIKIGATLTFGKVFIPKFISIIKEKYPLLEPYIYIDKTSELENKILKGDLDFCLVEGLILSNEIEATPFRTDRLVLVANPSYNIPDEISYKDINKYSLLLRESGSSARYYFDYKLKLKGITVKPTLESASNAAIIFSTLEGLGVAVLPIKVVESYIENKTLKEIKIDVKLDRTSYIIMHKNKNLLDYQKNIFELCLKMSRDI